MALFFFHSIPEQTSKGAVQTALPKFYQKIDFLGFGFFAPASVMILLAISWGGEKYVWKSATIIGLFFGAFVTGIFFGLWQWFRQDRALIPPRILKKPVVLFSCMVSFLQGGAFFMMGYYLPLWFQAIQRVTPTESGIRLLPTMISQIIASGVCGALCKYYCSR
jgi:hypothetical protein